MFFGVQFINIFQMLFNKKYCLKNLSFFFSHPPRKNRDTNRIVGQKSWYEPNRGSKIVIRTESWVKNRDTNRIVGLVYRYSPRNYVLCIYLSNEGIKHHFNLCLNYWQLNWAVTEHTAGRCGATYIFRCPKIQCIPRKWTKRFFEAHNLPWLFFVFELLKLLVSALQ